MRPYLSSFATSLCLIALVLSGCLTRDKHKHGQTYTPPWDNGSEALEQLQGYVHPRSDSLFEVFRRIEKIDSLAGPRKDWKYEGNSPDTLRAHHLIDTNFVFPVSPEDTYPFAFDETFRDDTLFRKAYGNGLFVEDHPCTDVWVAVAPFVHPVRWLKAGMSEADIIKAMGTPSLKHKNALRYLYRDANDAAAEPSSMDSEKTLGDDSENNPASLAHSNAFKHLEGIHFYFQDDGLFAAVFQRGRACH